MEESPKKNCVIKKVIVGDSLINPFLINIDNRSLSNEEISQCECSWYDSNADKTARVIKFVNHDKAVYQGTGKISKKMCKTMLVLQNKRTNKIKLVEISECRLGRALPKPNLRSDYDNDEIEATYEENQLNLHKAFGSKKSKRMVEIGSRMKINSDLTMNQMKHTASGIQVDQQELEMVDCIVDTCMPPCHRDATSPSEVFLLEDFLTPRELNSMADEAFVVFNLMPFTQQESGYSQFFIETLDRLQNKVTEERIKILLYIESLLKFLNVRIQDKRWKELVKITCPFSPMVAKKIIDNFSSDTTNGRIRNVIMNDKIAIHIIILVLIVCDNCNINELSRYLPRFSVTKLSGMARALSLSTKDKVNWFIKLPLPPIKSRYIRKRKN